jgi:hypothetical protein
MIGDLFQILTLIAGLAGVVLVMKPWRLDE